MTPAGYVVIDEIPITAHGKIDRTALPEPEIHAPAPSSALTPRATGTERRVAELFAELLGRDRVGADDSFFDLGGHSLLATKLVAAVRSQLRRRHRRAGRSSSSARWRGWPNASISTSADRLQRGRGLVAIPHDGPLQMSASQLRMWFQYRIDGPEPGQQHPVRRQDHRTMRRRRVGGRGARRRRPPREYCARPTAKSTVCHTKSSTTPARLPVRRARGDDEAWLQAELDRERGTSSTSSTTCRSGPRCCRPRETHVVSLVVHHIAADHWSAMVLFTDLLTAYRARRATSQAPELAPLPVQYADYAAWQAALLADDRRTRCGTARVLARAAGRPAGGPRPAPRFPTAAGAERGGRCRRVHRRRVPPAPSSRT